MTKKIKRICMLTTHGYVDPVPQLGRTDTGGQVVYVLELAKALAGLGIEVDIVTRWFDREAAQFDPMPDCPGVQVLRVPAGPWEFIAKEEIYGVLPELSKNLLGIIDDGNIEYDLFHGHYVDAGIVTLDVAAERKKPAFFTAHSLGAWKRDQMKGDPEEMERKYNFKHRIEEELRIFRSMNASSLTTDLQKEKLEQLYGFTASNLAVIPPGVNVHQFFPPRNGRELNLTLPEKYIFCLSRIDTNKGHDFLLNAFEVLCEKIGDIELVIGGGSPSPLPREQEILDGIAEMVNNKGLEEKVDIIGYVPDENLVPLYQSAEIFVLPSLFEPFGMTSLEAMACGTPVVASKHGGIKTVITSGENGLLVDPADSAEFAGALESLLSNAEFAHAVSAAATETIEREYSWEAIAQRHLDFFGEYLTA